MQILEQFYTIIVVACLLLVTSFKDILTNRLLKWVLLLLLYSESIRIILETGSGNISTFVIMSGYIARSLFIPASYLYLRNHFNKSHLVNDDIVNLVPCAIFCIGCTASYFLIGNLDFLSISSKQSFLSFDAEQVSLLCFRLFVYCLTGFYLWLILLMLKKNYLGAESREYIKVPITANGFNGHTNGHSHSNGHTINGNNGHVEKKNGETQSFFLTEERMKHIDSVVKEFLSEKKPFLQHGYSLKHLSEETNVPLHLLSAFINRYYKMNFNDFINEYRVSHCKVKIINKEWKYKKLEAIADESGFSNRNTFTSAFKKATGLNPSAFLKKLKAEQKPDDVVVMEEIDKIQIKKVVGEAQEF